MFLKTVYLIAHSPLSPTVDLPSEYRSVPEYAFHATQRGNLHGIRTDGIRADSPNIDSTTILDALDSLGYTDPFPFDRNGATYCYIDGDYAAGTLSEMAETGLATDDALVVVDLNEIDAPMFLADMSHITDLIDYHLVGIDAMLHADTPEEAVESYRRSIARVKNANDVVTYTDTEKHFTELIVDGDIPPGAIVDVIK